MLTIQQLHLARRLACESMETLRNFRDLHKSQSSLVNAVLNDKIDEINALDTALTKAILAATRPAPVHDPAALMASFASNHTANG